MSGPLHRYIYTHHFPVKHSPFSPPQARMNQDQGMKIAQFRDSVRKLGCSTEGYGDITLMRFMVARSLDKDKAAKMFVDWLKWRTSFVPLGYIPASEVQDELASKKIFLQGPTRKGHPVVIVKVSNHYQSKDQLQFKKFVVHLLDKTIASGAKGKEVGNEKMVALLDLNQIAYKNIDVRGLITGFQFLQAYYPERLAKCYILHMPGFFARIWGIVSRFLDKATLEKIVNVKSDEERRAFIEDVGKDVLPVEYGGQAKLTTIQDVELKRSED